MHPIVLNIFPIQPALVGKILPELFVNVRRAHSPAILAIDGIAEARRIDNGQPEPDAFLLDVHRFAFDPCRLLDALVGVRHDATTVQVAQKQAVDHRRLAESRFADHHQRELKTTLNRLTVHLLRQCGEADVVAVAIEAAANAYAKIDKLKQLY